MTAILDNADNISVVPEMFCWTEQKYLSVVSDVKRALIEVIVLTFVARDRVW